AYAANAERYAGEIARQYYQSAALPGAERGVAYCLATADRAERAGALEEVADALAMALALLPADDARRGRLLARRGLALSSTKHANEAAAIAVEAAELLAVSDGRAAAADYLAEVAGFSRSREHSRRRGPSPATVSPSRKVAATGPGRCCADTTSIVW